MTRRYTVYFVVLTAAAAVVLAVCFSGLAQRLSNHHPLLAGPAGSVSWALLAQAKGFSFTKDLRYVPRRYPEAVKELADHEILIKGYMVAIRPSGVFSDFLLVPFPPTCPYCVPGGPSQIIEAHTSKPVAFSFAPVVLRGVLGVREDDTSSLFYFMKNTEIAED